MSASSVLAPDPESARWLQALGGEGETRRAAVERLHELLLRAARFEVARRGGGGDRDDLATQAADDALMAVLAISLVTGLAVTRRRRT